ncbi:two-component system, CitB family, response regulator DctR [Cytobacillus horneckiae]|uniref:Two-component system response regulator n=1 Tax=Cytobacillus horneckiae TaxID=549687 RepID=A0A2N0ZEJ1_9BACI|nr:response regulator [Cytobacillus horneckiae]MEC1154651.1 response regulator [Cytobacillus horneckiae]MED2938992.1 response regulator [Cytobacillus horneckiae]PKG27930.1 two-component system response regulator [Cytobacillus horneckiae]
MDKIKVLLIEDDPMVQEVNKGFIANVKGFEIAAVASNGDEGIQLAKSVQPDLIILDIFMPKKDGIKTMHELRKQKINAEVIVVSAAKDKDTIKLMLQNGALDYIIKPFKFDRIEQALEKFRQYRESLKEAGTMSQEQLDLLLYTEQAKKIENDLPKGLNEFTLKEVISYMNNQIEPLSAGEVAHDIGIARVTARRYLDYLEKKGVIKLDVQYGGVGRPVNRYVLNN